MQENLSEVVLILVGSTLTMLILITLVVIALLISQKRKYKHRREVLEIKNAFEREVLKIQLETQAQTLGAISRELHDNVGTILSIALVHLKSPKPDGTTIEEAKKLIDEGLGVLRDISRSLNPEAIQRKGLRQAIADEVERVRKTGQFEVGFNSEGNEFSMDPQMQIVLFRIVQEAITNAVKHARATRIDVTVSFNEPGIIVTVQDNGQGFIHQPELGGHISHSGLLNMDNRARLLHGKLHIHSVIDEGTRIRLELPGSVSVG